MPQNDIKFIAADMDGTLLDQQGKLPVEFFDIYHHLAEQDILFCAASGRQYFSLRNTFSPIKDDILFIAENGALVMYQDKELYSHSIDKPSIKAIIAQARLIDGAHIVLSGKNSAYIETRSEPAIEEIKKYYHRYEQVADLLDVEDDIIKVAICHFDGSERYIHPSINAAFGHSHKVVISAKIWLDIMHSATSKGAAIKHLQKTLGFSFKQTMSFGDYFNDVEMLQASFHSYAMENAHERVKIHANHIAPSNKDLGVLKVISQHLSSIE
ncbi:HAD family hydrolase [Vibrio sp. MA40-2]|uniref:HAD family hydrolase n=1 Tax=Vibrio sp. MA40-2 TaxID=3391828 RepID=UPI0039A53592